MLSFTDSFKTKIKKEKSLPYLENLYLTNSVSHSNSQCTTGAEARMNFWGMPVPDDCPSAMLKLCTNDESSPANFRIDTSGGRLLSFSNEGNHIRAGSHSPCDAVLSIYQYYNEILDGTGRVYPMHITVPNIVACGEFKESLSHQFSENGLVSSSDKFPGYAVALKTGATPVVYPGKQFQKKRFIVPGLLSVDQSLDTLERLHAITHVD